MAQALPHFGYRFGVGLLLASGVTTSALAAVTISNAQTQNMNCSGGVCTPTSADAVLNVGDLTAMLASGNVDVTTGSGSLAQEVDDIVVAAGFEWTGASALTLDAYRSVTVESAVANKGSGPVSLITNDGGDGGSLSFGSKGSLSFAKTSTNLTLNGQTYTLVADIARLASDIAANPSGFYALSSNYNASKDGTYNASPITTEFAGTFNGLGNTISKLAIVGGRTASILGLFATIGSSGAVDSVRLQSALVSGDRDVYIGGLAGQNEGTVFGSSVTGTVTAGAGSRGGTSAGGLVGVNAGEIVSSDSSAQITVKGKSSDASAFLGGLAGTSYGSVEESFATGNADEITLHSIVGGLIGRNEGLILNSYASGAARSGNNEGGGGYVGGLTGINDKSIGSSYSIGVVSGGSVGGEGGSIGYDDRTLYGGTVSNDYWDTKTSKIANLSQGAGNIPNDPGITGETTGELKAGLPMGFDPTVWAEDKKINRGLPYLIANPPPK